MLATFLSGLGTGAGLIIAIGAQNAFVLRQGLLRQHVLPVVLVCIGGDILCICAGVAGMGALIRTNEWLLEFFRWGGALFLTVYGISAARRAASGNGSMEISEVGAGSLMKAITSCLAFTFLNPHVYLDTVVLLGSIAAQYGKDLKWTFASGALTASVLWFTGLGFGARLLLPIFQNPKAWRILDCFCTSSMRALRTLRLASSPMTRRMSGLASSVACIRLASMR